MNYTDGTQEAFVSIIGPDDGWILERLARCLSQKLPYAQYVPWKPSNAPRAKLNYYVNYALFSDSTESVDVGFFTHFDQENDFLARAHKIDHCVSMSMLYADFLREIGIKSVTHIPMGFDYYFFRPQLLLGVFSTFEHPRKGSDLVFQLRQLPYVRVVTTEGSLDEVSLRNIYQMVDYVLIPASVEGGPMSLLEGLCMGKPIIAPSNIGIVPEFEGNPKIRHYAAGNFTSLRLVVERCYQEKAQDTQLLKRRTWDNWALDHHQLFNELLSQRNERLPTPAPGFRFGLLSELEFDEETDVHRLEQSLDNVNRKLYFGHYWAARELIEGLLYEFPFAESLLDTIPCDRIYKM